MLTGNVLSEQALWEKSAKIKRVEHSSLGSELKSQSAIVKDQHALLNIKCMLMKAIGKLK